MGANSSKAVAGRSTPRDVQSNLLWALDQQMRWTEQCASAKRVLTVVEPGTVAAGAPPAVRHGAINGELLALQSRVNRTLRSTDDMLVGHDTLNIGRTNKEINTVGRDEARRGDAGLPAQHPAQQATASKTFAAAAESMLAGASNSNNNSRSNSPRAQQQALSGASSSLSSAAPAADMAGGFRESSALTPAQERTAVASKYLFIHSLLQRLVRLGEACYQHSARNEYLRKRIKPKRTSHLSTDELNVLHQQRDQGHVALAQQLEQFDRARDALRWMIRDYQINYALQQVHQSQLSVNSTLRELEGRASVAGVANVDDLGQSRGGIGSMSADEARAAGYDKRDVNAARGAPQPPPVEQVYAPGSNMGPGHHAHAGVPAAAGAGAALGQAIEQHHASHQQQHGGLFHHNSGSSHGTERRMSGSNAAGNGSEESQRINSLHHLMQQLEAKENSLRAALIANEKESLAVGLQFLDSNYSGALEPHDAPELSPRLYALLDVKHRSAVTREHLNSCLARLSNNIAGRERELANLTGGAGARGALGGSARPAHEAERIAQLQAQNREDQGALSELHSVFMNSFARHVFGMDAAASGNSLGELQSVDVNRLFDEQVGGSSAWFNPQNVLDVDSDDEQQVQHHGAAALPLEAAALAGTRPTELESAQKRAHGLPADREFIDPRMKRELETEAANEKAHERQLEKREKEERKMEKDMHNAPKPPPVAETLGASTQGQHHLPQEQHSSAPGMMAAGAGAAAALPLEQAAQHELQGDRQRRDVAALQPAKDGSLMPHDERSYDTSRAQLREQQAPLVQEPSASTSGLSDESIGALRNYTVLKPSAPDSQHSAGAMPLAQAPMSAQQQPMMGDAQVAPLAGQKTYVGQRSGAADFNKEVRGEAYPSDKDAQYNAGRSL